MTGKTQLSYKLLLDEIVGAPTINEHENGVADNVSDEADVEAKLHDESTMIQRCFDDNNDDIKR